MTNHHFSIGRTSSSGESLMSKSSRSSKGDLETLKLHNEVIEQAKYQNWPIQKKLRVVQQAKQYVRRYNNILFSHSNSYIMSQNSPSLYKLGEEDWYFHWYFWYLVHTVEEILG